MIVPLWSRLFVGTLLFLWVWCIQEEVMFPIACYLLVASAVYLLPDEHAS